MRRTAAQGVRLDRRDLQRLGLLPHRVAIGRCEERHGCLGWGRGFYDKTLGSMERCPPVYAVVFDSEFVDELPSDELDERVTGVVTPTRTITLAPTRR